MRNFTRVAVLCSLFTFTLSAVATETIKISTIRGSNFVDVVSPILESAYGQLGIAIEIIPFQAAEALRRSNSGWSDAESHRIIGIENKYRHLVPVQTPLTYLRPTLFYREGLEPEIKSWQDLASYRIAVQKGVRFAENNTKGMQKLRADTLDKLFVWLDQDTVDIIITNELNGMEALHKSGFKGIRSAPVTDEVYLMRHLLTLEQKRGYSPHPA